MAAFLGRSLVVRRGFVAVCWEGVDAVEEVDATGFDFCASSSLTLALDCRSERFCAGGTDRPELWGVPLSVVTGIPPAIEVSGIPEFRGGGGKESGRVYGRKAVAVCISRFEERYMCPYDENDRGVWVHFLLNGLETNLKEADDVTGG